MSEAETDAIITPLREHRLHLDRHPLLIAEMLASEDKSLRKSVIPLLVAYLREHGSPMLTEMANWLDPEADTIWRMKIGLRHPGASISTIRQPMRDAELLDEYEERLTKSGRVRSKVAKADLAKKYGRTAKTIEATVTRARHRKAKMAP